MKIASVISNLFKSFFPGSFGQSFYAWYSTVLGGKTHPELLKEYKNLTSTCIVAISEDVGKYDPIFGKKDRRTGKLKVLKTHPFETLLENPNPNMTQFELFEATQSYIELVGECFWFLVVGEVSRKPKEILIVRPDRVKIAIDEDEGIVKGYAVRRDDGTEIPVDLDEMVHFKTFNPIDPFRGLGVVARNLLYIETENRTSEFQNNYMRNQATPSGILTLKGKMKKEAFLKLKKQWKEQYSNTENAGKTLFIRKVDAEFTKMGLDLSELDMGDLKKLTREDVLEGFRVPEAILGKADVSGLGRSNIQTLEYIFAKRTIDPKLKRIDDTLEIYVREAYNQPDLEISHESQVPEDKKANLENWDKGVDRWITRNEIRESNGLDPMDGGDVLFATFNQIPIDDVDETQETKSIKKVKLIRKKPDCSYKCDCHKKKRKSTKKVFATKQEENLNISLDQIENKGRKDYRKELNKLLNIQNKEVLKLLPVITGKQIIEWDGVEFGLSFEDNEILRLVAILLNILQDGGDEALEVLELPELEFLVSQATRNAIFESTSRLLQSFNEETALKIQKQIAGGLAEDESVEQLTKRIESIYEEAKGHRAKRIAFTEAHTSINEGVAQAWKQGGVKKVQWVAFPPSCQFCNRLDGEIVDIGQSFVVRGDTVNGEEGGEFLNDYKDIRFADLHPFCDCRLKIVD